MLNKLFIMAATAGLALILLFGRDVASYITTSADQVSSTIRDQIPVEFEIERARNMINEFKPQIRKSMVTIAREEIEIENLNEEIANLASELEQDRSQLVSLQRELESGQRELKIGETLYTSSEITSLAEKRFEHFQTQDKTLKNLQRTRDVRVAGLKAAQLKVDEMVAAKEQLAAEVAGLEARQRMNEVTRANNQSDLDPAIDDSHLARTRELIKDIETRVRVAERLTATELHFMEEVVPVVETKNAQNIAAKIANYFANEHVEQETTPTELLVAGSQEPVSAETSINESTN